MKGLFTAIAAITMSGVTIRKFLAAGIFLVLTVAFALPFAEGDEAEAREIVQHALELTMSTTSIRDSGLLDYLLPKFTKETGLTVFVLAKDTGAVIRDGGNGNVDVIFVHAPQREIKLVADGFGTKRYAVMHNDFVIVGPAKTLPASRGAKAYWRLLKPLPPKTVLLYPKAMIAALVPKNWLCGSKSAWS